MTEDGCCSSVLRALSDETRWRIVRSLVESERANVTTLAQTLRVAQPSMSKHLRVLRNAGLIVAEKEGTVVWCRVAPGYRSRERSIDLGCCEFRFDQARRSSSLPAA